MFRGRQTRTSDSFSSVDMGNAAAFRGGKRIFNEGWVVQEPSIDTYTV